MQIIIKNNKVVSTYRDGVAVPVSEDEELVLVPNGTISMPGEGEDLPDDPRPLPQEVEDAMTVEGKIKDKIRDLAIKDLIKSGDLPADYRDK